MLFPENHLAQFDVHGSASIFWFRRDLRLHDNAGLYHALRSTSPVIPLFIFDTDILGQLHSRADRRIEFIHKAMDDLHKRLEMCGSGLLVLSGRPIDVFRRMLDRYKIEAVIANEDYEPYARKRDGEVGALLQEHGSQLCLFKDQVIHAKNEILTGQGTPFQVFTAYKAKWLEATADVESFPSENYLGNIARGKTTLLPIEYVGFTTSSATEFSPPCTDEHTLRAYAANRDVPALDATTHTGVHLRFGTVSVRNMVRLGREYSEVWLSELIWREFFIMVLYHRPDVVDSCYRREFNGIRWRNNDTEFRLWCEGKTGFPLVDAGMRQLNATGFMHNRVRMAVASFLVKDLLIDWRWGEAYFAEKLLDYDLAANNGNWQWAAGTGCDAAPYFRIFNPENQRKKFDPHDEYCRKWIPELYTGRYATPVVDHLQARKRTLLAFADAAQEYKGINGSKY